MKIISWISIISVFVGVTALILVTSIMNGFNETIRSRMFGVEPHVVMTPSQLGQEGEFQLEQMLPLVKKMDLLENVTFVTKTDVILRTFEGLFELVHTF